MDEDNARQEIAAALSEFIEATVHEILHLREIYTPDLFQRQRLYNITVRKSRHPHLNDYISNTVQSLKEAILHGRIQKVAVLILDSSGCVVEQYVMQVQMQLDVLRSLDIEDIESALRACLLKLQYADACFKPLAKGCTFEIVAYAQDRHVLPPEEFVEDEPALAEHLDQEQLRVVPIKSADVAQGAFRLQLYAVS